MKTEISRDSHQKTKRYSGVYQQQGRMLTDSDWNELVEILKLRLNDSLRDVVGIKSGSAGGTPRHRALRIVDDPTDTFKIQPGHVYADGVAAWLPGDSDLDFDAQPDFPDAPTPTVNYRLYADVWERTVTPLMDERLRDKGLHGADTCSRKQMLAQIKFCPDSINPETSALNPALGDAPLSLTLLQKTTDPDPCDPCAAELDVASKVGNYLFRVEVHDVQGDTDNPTEITLKWSTENGAEHFEALPSEDDMPAGFISDKWIYEFYDETSERHLGVHLDNTAWTATRGVLSEIKEPGSPYAVPAIPGSSATQTFVRRWDGYCKIDLSGNTLLEGFDRGVNLSTNKTPGSLGYVDIGASLEIILESIKLELELNNKSFVAGDYWLADVREAEHDPLDPLKSILIEDETPLGIEHRYLILGHVSGGNLQANPEADRKYAFPSLSEMTRLFMAGGDGQEIVPGDALPQPLRVGVANGEWPVQGATVRFVIEAGGGSIAPLNSGLTDADGIAECVWTPDAVPGAECRVRASLVDSDDAGDASKDLDPPVYFYANLITADQVAYTPACEASAADTVHNLLANDAPPGITQANPGFYTVKEALDALLCELRARHIPYDVDSSNSARWTDVNEEEGASAPQTVQQAIDALLNNLHSEDVVYPLANCSETNRLKDYLETLIAHDARDAPGEYRIRAMWDALMCHLDADVLPYNADTQTDCWQDLGVGSSPPQTVQEAIDVLACTRQQQGCCTINISPGDDIEQRLSVIANGQDADICFDRGQHIVKQTIELANKGRIVIHGCSESSRILAPNSESVFRFRGCVSIDVHDIAMLSSQSGDSDSLEHLGGTLDIIDVDSVSIDHVDLTCPASDAERSACCLRVSYDQPANSRASIRVQRSRLHPGHQQIGLLLVNAARAQVEDNEIHVRRKSAHWVLQDKLKEKTFRQSFRKTLVSNLSFSQESSVSNIYRNASVTIEDQTLYFSTDPDLSDSWGSLIENNPPAAGTSGQALIAYMKSQADNVLLNQGEVGIPDFSNWYLTMASSLPAIANQGIVCAGRAAQDIHILNNTLNGVGQGVHVGLSHDTGDKYQAYVAGRVQIQGNHITNYLSAEYQGERHGIFVGNCDSLDIESNYTRVEFFPNDKSRSIEALRLYGFMGARLLVRHNHGSGYSTGAFVRVLNGNDDKRHVWQVVSNMFEGARKTVDIDPASQFLVEHNA